MADTSLPIDPQDCEFKIERVSPAYAKLNVKVPGSLVKRFRKKMRRAGLVAEADELSSALAQFCVAQGLKDQPFRVVTPPALADGSAPIRAIPDKDFACTIGLDLALPLSIPDLSGVVLSLPDYPVTDALVQEEVESQCRQFGDRRPADAVERGSECVMDVSFRVQEGEKPVLAAENTTVSIPLRGNVLLIQTLQAPGLAEALCGARAGETRTIQATFPTNLPNSILQGKPSWVTVKIREIRRVEPATVERVLKEYGMPSEARLRNQIRFALEDKRTRDGQSILREQLAARLPEVVEAEVPVMRSRILRANAERQLLGVLSARGIPDDAAKAEHARALPALYERADRQARLCLILHSLSGELGLTMDEDFVAGRLAAIAAERGVRPEVLRAEMVKSGQYKEFVEDLGIEIALDKLLRSAPVQTVPAAEWEARHSAGPTAG